VDAANDVFLFWVYLKNFLSEINFGLILQTTAEMCYFLSTFLQDVAMEYFGFAIVGWYWNC
jgi:hypothetical protein